jgi:hypothetical protein
VQWYKKNQMHAYEMSTYVLIWRSLKVAVNRSIILKYMYEIVMAATSNRIYYHKVQDHSLPISNPA